MKMNRRVFFVIGYCFSWRLDNGRRLQIPAKAHSVRFAAYGDMGTGEKPEFETSDANESAAQGSFPFDFAIALGTTSTAVMHLPTMSRNLPSPYKALLDEGVKFYAALGNHDDAGERFYKPFNMNGANYYSFKKGNVKFFAWIVIT